MKINNKRELQNIAINHFADIDYKDFVKKPYSLLTIDTALPGTDPPRFRKNSFQSYKNDSNWWALNYWQQD